jgi:hypothetical protein
MADQKQTAKSGCPTKTQFRAIHPATQVDTRKRRVYRFIWQRNRNYRFRRFHGD